MKKRAALRLGLHLSGGHKPAVLSVLLLAAAVGASAQTPGDTDQVAHEVPFTSAQTLELDPSPNVGPPVRQAITAPLVCANPEACAVKLSNIGKSLSKELIKDVFGVNIPGEVLDVIDFLGIKPLKITFRANAGISGYFQVSATTKGEVGIHYPVRMTVDHPAPNTFACGDQIDLDTAMTVSSPVMIIDPPYHEIEFGADVDEMGLEVVFDFCTPRTCLFPDPSGGCEVRVEKWCLSDELGVDEAKVSTPSWDPFDFPPLIRICGDAFKDGATHSDLVGCGAANEVFGILGIGLMIDDSNAGLVKFNNVIPKTPQITGEFRRARAQDLSLEISPDRRTLLRSGVRQDTVDFLLDFVSLADYLVRFGPPGVNITRVTLPGVGNVDLGDITVNYIADHEMDFTFYARDFFDTFTFAEEVRFQEMTPAGQPVGPPDSGTVATLTAGNRLRIDFPQELSDPLPVSPLYAMDGSLTTLTKQSYSVGSDFQLLKANIPSLDLSGALIEEQLAEVPLGTSKVIESHTIADLGGFEEVSRPDFVLDPEKPVLDVSHHGVRDVVNLGNGERAIVYRVGLRNAGDVRLFDIEADLDLAAAFATAAGFEAACTHSADLVVNDVYDGASDINLLAADNVLETSQNSPIDALVRVRPEVSPIVAGGCFASVDYLSAAHTRGVSPIGTAISNNFNQCAGTQTGEDLLASVDLGAAVIDELSDYAIYGWKGVDLDRGLALSRGNVGSGGDLAFRPRTSGTSTAATIVGDLHAARDVHVSQSHVTFDYAQIGGSLFLNDPNASFDATGAISLRSQCPALMPAPSLALPPVEDGQRIDLQDNEVQTLGPGEYATITLGEGSVLKLTNGTFNVGLLRIAGNGAVVSFDTTSGPIFLNLHDWRARPWRGLAFVLADDELSTLDVTINYAGRRGQVLRGGLIQGTLIAPWATIEFDQASVLQGACYARRVSFGPGSSFSHHEFLEDLLIDVSCRDAVTRP